MLFAELVEVDLLILANNLGCNEIHTHRTDRGCLPDIRVRSLESCCRVERHIRVAVNDRHQYSTVSNRVQSSIVFDRMNRIMWIKIRVVRVIRC